MESQRIAPAARAYEQAAAAYDRGRPGYPPEAVGFLTRAVGLRPGARVVDVGAGTGKLTALLVPTGAHLTAVEPVAAMRARLTAALPGVPALDGTAERLPFPHASLDAAVAAQAFHWFEGPAALAELARVLVPGGGLGLIWNARDERVDWVAEITALLDAQQGDAPRYKTGAWRRAFLDQPWFSPLSQRTFTHTHRLPVPAMADRFGSVSFIAALGEARRRAVLTEVEGFLRAAAGADDVVAMPYRTDVYWTTRR